jgi:uncharacterized RDD family membrane protein YckC
MPRAAGVPSFGRRLAAFGLDYLLIAGYLVVLGAVGTALTLGPLGEWWRALTSSPLRMDAIAFLTSILPVIVYFALLDGGARGATWGKRRMRIRVSSEGGGPLGAGRALVRSVVKFLPWQLAHTSLLHIPGWPTEPRQPPIWVIVGMATVWAIVGIYIVTALARADGRSLYDLVAGSRVVSTDTESFEKTR